MSRLRAKLQTYGVLMALSVVLISALLLVGKYGPEPLADAIENLYLPAAFLATALSRDPVHPSMWGVLVWLCGTVLSLFFLLLIFFHLLRFLLRLRKGAAGASSP